MPKRPKIDTSVAAFHSLDQSRVQDIKNRIMEALKILGRGSSEQIADYLCFDYDSIWKRCSDLKNEGKIFASDHKVLTRKKRFARQWIICDSSQPKVERKREKALLGEGISDYSRKLIPPTTGSLQRELF